MDNWKIRSWSEVLKIVNGKNQKEVQEQDGEYPIYGSGGIMAYANDYLCDANTTVIGRKGTINSPIYVETKFWNVDTAFGISPGNELEPKFLYYFCLSYDFTKHNKSTTLPSLTKRDLLKVKMPVPSDLETQKEIVLKLDTFFDNINNAIKLLEKNISHSRALMGSILDETFSNGEIPLKESCTIGPKKSEVRHLDSNREVSFLPMRDLNEHQISFRVIEKKPLGEVYKGYTYFAEEDVILAKVTPCFENGKAGVARNLVNKIGFGSSEYHILRPNDGVLSEWIYFAILSEQFRVTGKENMTGSGGLKRVPRRFVENWKIPLPKPEIQQKEINRLKEVQEYTFNLEQEYENEIRNLETLKKSLLDKAFKGEL